MQVAARPTVVMATWPCSPLAHERCGSSGELGRRLRPCDQPADSPSVLRILPRCPMDCVLAGESIPPSPLTGSGATAPRTGRVD